MADEGKKQNGNMTNEAGDSGEESADNAPGSIQEELAQLREKAGTKEIEAKEHYDRYLRQVAEVDNFKKRINREKDDAIRYANEHLIKDILPVIDNLERAIAHAKGGGGKPVVEGVEMVLRGLLDIFNKHGVVQIPAVGEIFDPGKHEAMAQVESDQHEPNTVIDEHHKGYIFRDRLVRPALVTVAKAPTTKVERNDGNEVEKDSTDD